LIRHPGVPLKTVGISLFSAYHGGEEIDLRCKYADRELAVYGGRWDSHVKEGEG
jgi:hypothetical protein